MSRMIFTGMLISSVSSAGAAAVDLEPAAAGKQVDALIRSLDGHFDREAAEPLRQVLLRDRDRLAAIRSQALLRAAIDELVIQAGDPILAAAEDSRDAA